MVESEVACVLPQEQHCIHHQMNINTVPLMPCIITSDLSTEESEGYTQILQTYDIQFNNIMNLDIKNPSNSNSDAKEEEEIPSGRFPCQC